MRWWTAVLAAGLAGLGLSAGCGGPSTATVGGQVAVDGKPLEKGTISYTGPDGNSAAAEVGNGRYQLVTTPGANRVQISAPVGTGKKVPLNGPNAPPVELTEESLPDRYNSKSDLTVEVPGGSFTKDWSAESKARKK